MALLPSSGRLLLRPGQVVGEELQGTLARQRSRLRVVGLTRLAIEAVPGLVLVEDTLRVGSLDLVHVAERNAAILGPEVIHHGTLRAPVEIVCDTAVIHDCAGDRQLAGGHVRHGTAPAVADAPYTSGVPDDRDGRREILQGVLQLELFHVA